MTKQKVLEMRSITKRFPGVLALDNVDFDVNAGEIHALLGENGAGKSTLIKVLAGIHKPDNGEIFIHGNKLDAGNVNESKRYEIGVVYQELSLAVNMTVAENIFLGRVPTNKIGLVDDKRINREARDILDNMKLYNIKPEDTVKRLSIAERQMIEIAKVLSRNVKILVLDEPTASLTNKEIDDFFKLILNLKENGISMIYVSHRIDEVIKLADRVTILRDGKHIVTKQIEDTDYYDIISTMVGRDFKDVYPKLDNDIGEVVLSVKNLSTKNSMVKDLSFDLHKGEILGFYGLVGSGRSEAMQSILGLLEKKTGEISIMGNHMNIRTPREALDMGLVMTPESRKEQGLIMIQDIDFNITLTLLDKLIHGVKLNKKKNDMIVDSYCKKLAVKTPSYQQLVKNLSGGNQQKVILARWLATDPKILILDEPTTGIDIGTKHDIYELMVKLAKEGIAIIFISSELLEIVGISNSVVVMREGEMKAKLNKDEISQEMIIKYAV